jgi:hypothetical protein
MGGCSVWAVAPSNLLVGVGVVRDEVVVVVLLEGVLPIGFAKVIDLSGISGKCP